MIAGPDHDFRVRQAMIGLAYASGDPDELIRVMDVRTPYDQVEIVEFLRAAGRADDALVWARAGLERFADRPHQLREFARPHRRAVAGAR